MNGIGGVLAAVIPSIGVGLLFWFAMRSIVNADRTERQALARMDREEAERAATNSSKESRPSI
ncbi:MAG: hypothetical protein NVV70_15700 [Cellulomonas sp.]|uniref:Uncharacterized protein n=1 Tax=Cellulomonas gelida TaxID=1712 RepID=A0A4Y3KKM7_9CELL|nr:MULTISPECIES: hypothetical protein [Cellulomonas]MCR6649501.1 hypothetical protein [Cellulomonas sp.]GEA84567.1 hypothetical protein CGE01nite_18180 [Cellulomonas gelida]GGL17732.1 hypothetical protein GCM10009774_05100 [Cellulomonas gelida]